MIYQVKVTSNTYLDDVPEISISYSTEDVIDFSDYVTSLVAHIEGLMRFDPLYRDTVAVSIKIFVHGKHVANERFNRSTEGRILRTRDVIA